MWTFCDPPLGRRLASDGTHALLYMYTSGDVLCTNTNFPVESLSVACSSCRSPCHAGEVDDAERFLFFARAALEFLVWSEATQGKQPDVLHIHDWQSAAVAPLLKEQYRARGLTRPGVVLTVRPPSWQPGQEFRSAGSVTCDSKRGNDVDKCGAFVLVDNCTKFSQDGQVAFRPDGLLQHPEPNIVEQIR